MRAFRIATLVAAIALVPAASAQAITGGLMSGWGYNGHGQVGNGTESSSGCICVASPAAIPLPEVVEVSSGNESALALRADGTVVGWGEDEEGQVGNGEAQRDVTFPVTVAGLSGAIAVSSGRDHSLALLGNGTVEAWGSNVYGQIGQGTETGPEECGTFPTPCSKHPVAVPGLSDVVAIAAGENFSLALLGNGTVMAWGNSYGGPLGNPVYTPTPCECVDHPVAVPGVSGVRAIAAGGTGMALLDDNTVRSWGYNDRSQLGTGAPSEGMGCRCLGPVAPEGLPPVRGIASGVSTEAALLSDGTVRAWGANNNGQVGNGGPGPDECNGGECSRLPSPVLGESGGVEISAGALNFLVRRSDGSTVGWGRNQYADLGTGSNSPKEARSAVTAASAVLLSQIDMGGDGGHTLSSPTQSVSVTLAGSGTGTVDGRDLSCPGACTETRPQGETSYLLPEPSSPGQFAGFTGACAGTSACRLPLISDQSVTATFGVPKGTKIKAAINRKRRKARFAFTTPGAVTGYRCLLAKPRRHHRHAARSSSKKARTPKFRACHSGYALKHLKPGRYSLRVEALDIVGTEAKPAVRKFKIG